VDKRCRPELTELVIMFSNWTVRLHRDLLVARFAFGGNRRLCPTGRKDLSYASGSEIFVDISHEILTRSVSEVFHLARPTQAKDVARANETLPRNAQHHDASGTQILERLAIILGCIAVCKFRLWQYLPWHATCKIELA
jgi:hypothetical protein